MSHQLWFRTRMKVCENTAPSPEVSSLRDTTAERTCTSPFSKLLEQTQGNLTHDETRERTAIHSAPLGSPLPSTTSYVTSTELLALDQKLKPAETRVNKSPTSPPDDQFVTQKRPRPRKLYFLLFVLMISSVSCASIFGFFGEFAENFG